MTRHRITAGQAAASQEPPSPKTYLIFSFKVVLATPRRCCRLPWTSGLCVLSTTDVSFSPLIPPLGLRRVQALPARISVSSLLSQCVAAPPCQCHPRPALPALPRQPWVVGEHYPLPASWEGPVPAESPRSSPVGVLRWQLSPSEMADSSLALLLPGGFFSPPPCLCRCLRGCVGKAIGSRAADGFICNSSICSQQLTNNHGVPEELCYLELKFLQSGRAAALRRAQPLCKGQRRHGQGLRQELGRWPGLNYSLHPARQSSSPEPAWKPGPFLGSFLWRAEGPAGPGSLHSLVHRMGQQIKWEAAEPLSWNSAVSHQAQPFQIDFPPWEAPRMPPEPWLCWWPGMMLEAGLCREVPPAASGIW